MNSLVEDQIALLNVLAYMSLESPDISSDCPWQGYEHDANIASKGEDCIQVSKTTKSYYNDYRDAEKEMLHARNQGNQLRRNQLQLNQLPEPTKVCIGPALASLNDVTAALPNTPHLKRKRDHLKWVFGGKSEFERQISQSERIETLLNSNLLLSIRQDIEELKKESGVLKDIIRLNRNTVFKDSLVNTFLIRERRTAQVHHCNFLARVLNIKASVIVSKAKDQRNWKLFTRWPFRLPLGLSQVVIGQMTIQNCLPSLPKLVLRPQNVIPCDSEIIQACQLCDVKKLRKILEYREAHPNDRTPDDLTVFRYGIRTGNLEVVQLLLDHGADPNLPFGKFETSPLNNAFLIGHVAIIRLLLTAGADLDYKNSRTWTSASFLWDPARPAHATTSEIVEICMSQGFSAWNDTDPRGWTPCHRAGAYGRGEDIRSLECKGGNLHSYTTDHMWGPVTCAVWNSNESTFDAFMDLLPVEEVLYVKDTRGWMLLHIAAQNGCRHILRTLLDLGADLGALTVGTRYWVMESLEGKRLTAETIAREYGHGELWDEIVLRDK